MDCLGHVTYPRSPSGCMRQCGEHSHFSASCCPSANQASLLVFSTFMHFLTNFFSQITNSPNSHRAYNDYTSPGTSFQFADFLDPTSQMSVTTDTMAAKFQYCNVWFPWQPLRRAQGGTQSCFFCDTKSEVLKIHFPLKFQKNK